MQSSILEPTALRLPTEPKHLVMSLGGLFPVPASLGVEEEGVGGEHPSSHIGNKRPLLSSVGHWGGVGAH